MDASDFSFFDDDSQVADKFSSNFSKKESNSRKKSDSDHWDLHGTNNITNQVMKSSDVSDSDDSIDEVVQSPTTTATSSSCQKEDYHSPVILSSTDEDDDTLTDVSPQSSPESSPRMKRSFRYSFSEDEKDHGDSKISKNNSETKSENEQVKHITKLNVTFKQANTSDINLEKVPHRKSKPQKTKSHKSRTDGRFSIDHVEGTLNRYFKKDSSKQVTEHVSNSSHEKEAIKKEENKDIDLNHLLEIILDLEEKGINVKEKYKEQSSQRRANHNRRNMSFSNNQLREIEMENQRLFKELSKKTPRSRPSSAASTSTSRSRFSVKSSASSRVSTASSGRRSRNQSATPKLYHSAVNRANIQRQIERENMQILKRLQSAKATPGLQRSKQLRDYHQQTKYMGSGLPVRPKRHFAQLSRDPDIIQQALDIGEPHFGNLRPNWQDVW